MNKKDLKKLSKSQLIEMLLKQSIMKPVPTPRTKKPMDKPIPAPRKSVKKMVIEYEDNIILPPLEFRDDYKPIPAPRTKKLLDKPVPTPITKIEQTNKALKGYTKSYEISIKNNKDPLTQMQNTRLALNYRIANLLNEMKGLKYVETLKVTFEKMSGDEIVEKSAYFNSTPQTIINQMEINEALQMSKQ